MKAYQSSNYAPINGILLLTLFSVVGGFILGGLVYAVSKLVYLVLLFPLGAGLLGGVAAGQAVKIGKVRHPAIALIFGLLTGLIIYGTYNFCEYYSFRHEVYQTLASSNFKFIKNLSAQGITDLFLKGKTGNTGIWGYICLQAKTGIELSLHHGSSKIRLNELFSWFYLIVEMLIYAGIAGGVAYGAAKEPFCEKCNTWFSNKTPVGFVEFGLKEKFVHMLRMNYFQEAGQALITDQVPPLPRIELQMQRCPHCNGDILLEASEVTAKGKKDVNRKQIAKGMISGEEFRSMMDAHAQGTEVSNKK